jgi:exopolysaccharide production protein ExoQ
MTAKPVFVHQPNSDEAILAPRGLGTRERWWLVLLALFLIQFTGAWIYPPSAGGIFESIQKEKILGVPFQWSIWGLIVLGTFLHSARYGFGRLAGALRIFLPFWIVGVIAAGFGFDPFLSMRNVILWSLMALGAAVAGSELTAARAIRLMCITLAAIMLLSVALALFAPPIGTQMYGLNAVWRGAFTYKNQLGWAAALTLVISVVMLRRDSLWITLSAAALSGICLVGSGSKGALGAAIAALVYVLIVSRLARRVTPGFGIFLTVFTFGVVACIGMIVMPIVLELLGRDATLTGRTDIWQAYFNAMAKTPWFGEGPGAYTSLSAVTLPLAQKLQSFGSIVTPHNIFLGVLGDTGLFGLVTFLAALLYLTLVLPMMRPGSSVMLCAAIGFLILAHGLVETHEVLAPGPGWFLLILTYALALQEQRSSESSDLEQLR